MAVTTGGGGRQSRGALERGTTLIEVMLVVSIIALVASFAVPNLQEAKRVANETSAIAMSRALFDSQQQYRRQHGTAAQPFAKSLAELELGGLLPGNLVGASGPSGVTYSRDGYQFLTFYFTVDGSFAVCAIPSSFGKTGGFAYLIRDDGTIYRRKSAGVFFDPTLGEPVGN
jgi:type IV pilus assembly protein PilA